MYVLLDVSSICVTRIWLTDTLDEIYIESTAVPSGRRFKNRELKKTTTATATGRSLNKRFNEQNNGRVRAL